MGAKDIGFDVVYRGQVLPANRVREGRLVFFQRSLQWGGGYWLVRTYHDSAYLEMEYPVSLRQGMEYLMSLRKVREFPDFEEFELLDPNDDTFHVGF
ncbi:hypothetical protein PMPD1_3074 [Paramixta manurensis]|uniref:LF-82 n=1 Tax=Paramixta manurensis TaxID=2740817 RepID=A0A6M8UHY3_9GAMM|nr:hypothetical protein PMPD1_3074 [Erwiniaceae bacterium PD-1]